MSDTSPSPAQAVAIAELLIEVRYLRRDIEGLRDELTTTKAEVSQLQGMVTRYRGGLAVILGLGACVGWAISTVGGASKLWGH